MSLDLKRQLIEELLEHLDKSQGSDLDEMMNRPSKPGTGTMAREGSSDDEAPMGVEIKKVSILGKDGKEEPLPMSGALDSKEEPESDEDSKLKEELGLGAGVSPGKMPHGEDLPGAMIADHGTPPGMSTGGGSGGHEEDMSDEELKELLSKYLH